MKWFKNNPVAGGVLLGLLPLIGLEASLVRTAWHQAQQAEAELGRKKQDRDRLIRLSPAPSEANERAIEQDLLAAKKTLESLQTAWRAEAADGTPTPASSPIKPIEAYFKLAAFVERARALAAESQVQLGPAEHFGFKSYATEGPDPELVTPVMRQRATVQYLVETLLKARPRALLAVQRERPRSVGHRSGPGPSSQKIVSPGGQPDDFFEIAGPISMRVQGELGAEAYRVEFTGQTQNLRTYLNALASSTLPLVVRSVEAMPLGPDDAGRIPAADAASSPLIARSFSRFVVVAEHVLPLPPAEESAP